MPHCRFCEKEYKSRSGLAEHIHTNHEVQLAKEREAEAASFAKVLADISPYDWGWLAGIIDGEGTITIGKARGGGKWRRGFGWVFYFEISNTNLDIIERARRLLEPVLGPGWLRVDSRLGRRTAYSLRYMNRKRLRYFLPHLRLVGKEAQRRLVLEGLMLSGENGRVVKGRYDHILEDIWLKVAQVNQKGRRISALRLGVR